MSKNENDIKARRYLFLAVKNLRAPNSVSRVCPTQSVQALHFQTCRMDREAFREFKQKGSARTLYALDFIVKFRPENMHDNGHYLCIMFQGERIYERKRRHVLDIGFYRMRRVFLRAYQKIQAHAAQEKTHRLEGILQGLGD